MSIKKETDLLENKDLIDLNTGPNRSNSDMEAEEHPTPQDKEIIKDCNDEATPSKKAPYAHGYTGFIPGRNDSHTYGMTFKNVVEVGGKEWHKTQVNLWEQDAVRAHALTEHETNPTHLLSGPRADNVGFENDEDSDDKDRKTYDYHFDPEKPPTPGYTGHIPGAKHEVEHSKGYVEAAGFRGVQEERNPKNLSRARTSDNVDFESDDGYGGKDRKIYDYNVDSEKPPIPGYTGHIPGARLEVDHSKGYGESARIGFRGVQKERDERHAKEDMGY